MNNQQPTTDHRPPNEQPTTDHRPPTTDGILIIDKPADWTSHDVVAKVRKLCQTKRVGHTGTLDPFATGVLVICLNRATRLVQFLTGEDKEYLATIRFGFATDTGDLTGTPLAPPAATTHLNNDLIERALAPLRGHITQIPPMYSAKKIGGVKLYEMARRGEEIERAPIAVEIKHLSLESPFQNDECTIRVVCSSGTYIRTLAEDIGKQLGIGAHLTRLRRTRAGQCDLSRAYTLEHLAALREAGQLQDAVLPMNDVVTLPAVQVSATAQELIVHGRAIQARGNWVTGQHVKLVHNRELLAIAVYNATTQMLQPRIVF
ncbi:MAG TPA: tRNA pseudouridine(55) synthase TruB [Blastocatellia bacterium]|nr:tRNA pseudouridine(55) synthase TruB [Blastocatellia bacterium]